MIIPLIINLILILASAQNCHDGFLNGYRTCHADSTFLSSILPASLAQQSRHTLKQHHQLSGRAPPQQSTSPLSSTTPTSTSTYPASYPSRPWNWSHGTVGLSGYIYFSGHEDLRLMLQDCLPLAASPSLSSLSSLGKGVCLSRVAKFGGGAFFFFGLGDAALDVLRVAVGRRTMTPSAAAAARRRSGKAGAHHQVVVRREPAKATRASTLSGQRGETRGMVPGG